MNKDNFIMEKLIIHEIYNLINSLKWLDHNNINKIKK